MLFICFLGESTAHQSAYGFIWPLARDQSCCNFFRSPYNKFNNTLYLNLTLNLKQCFKYKLVTKIDIVKSVCILFCYNTALSEKRLNWMPIWPLVPPPLSRHRAAVILFEQGTSKVLCTKSIGSNASQVRSFWKWSMITWSITSKRCSFINMSCLQATNKWV